MTELWPTLFYYKPLASPATTRRLNRELLSDIKKISQWDTTGQRWSKENYANGYTSYSSMTNLHLTFAPFMELKKFIDKKVLLYAKAQSWDLGEGQLNMSTCWVNVMPKGSHHSGHIHPLSVISGTYYVQTPRQCGQFKIEDPRLGLFMGSPPRRAQAPQAQKPFFAIAPQAGRLVLFESWLRHEVTANASRDLRVSISFNYEWSSSGRSPGH